MAEVVHKAEFARRMGNGRSYVALLVKKGMPVREDGMIDVAKAEAWVAANVKRRKKKAVPAPQQAVEAVAVDVEHENGSNGAGALANGGVAVGDSGAKYAIERAKREAAVAALKELELQVKRGKLVDRDAVERWVFEMVRGARDAMLRIPERSAALLAAESNPETVKVMLGSEIEDALRAFEGRLGDE